MRSSAWLASRLSSANGALSSGHARTPPFPAALVRRGARRFKRADAAYYINMN